MIQNALDAKEPRVMIPLTHEQSRIERKHLDKIDAEIREELGVELLHPSELACSLRTARKAAGMSLADVACAAGMTKQAVLKIESGRNSNPKIDTLLRIAKAVGKSLKIELIDAA